MSAVTAIQSNWVAPPQAIGGLDHLGTQDPCIAIYSQLLPGITNVTDRARYYSFYPWLVWSFDRRSKEAMDFDAFLDFYRRADCLFTLIAERHARTERDDAALHGIAMVGRESLVPVTAALESGRSVRLSTYATREEAPQRYFANKLGGLGQYYLGTLTQQLEALAIKTKPWISCTYERGVPIAQAFEEGVPSAKFWQAVENDVVTVEVLDTLHLFCPCHLPQQAAEQSALLDTFFDRKAAYAEEGVQRRKSLALLLHLTQRLQEAGAAKLDETAFRAIVYTLTFPDGTSWTPPEPFRHTASGWAYYVRNDILSVAAQATFAVALTALAAMPEPPTSIEALSLALSCQVTVQGALRELCASTFGELCHSLKSSAPALGDFNSPGHELVWAAERVSRRHEQNDRSPAFLASVIRLLALLHARDDPTLPAYGHLAIDGAYLQESPINLASLRRRCQDWHDVSLTQVCEELTSWCLETHLHVALRKLRQTSKATFRLHPTERGILPLGDVPAPAKTNPRFRQAVKILWDLGALNRSADGTDALHVTDLGSQLYRDACV